MITKVTKDNKALYRALFEKATEDLAAAHPGEALITISSLDDYFLSIKDLTDLNGGDNTYAILPRDEPFLEINANTRVITVPSEFKTNGISVKGDQIAEILFFTIDRYYDTVDLYDPSVKIFIQCESPDGVQHVYREFLRDVSLFKSSGKMVFGWTIDNKITKQSGVLKFSVRFITTALNENEENEIIFSLSTLTANATINPGLDFTFNGDSPEAELIDNKNIIKKRIINSTPTADPGDIEIAFPVFFMDIPTQVSDIFLTENEVIEGESYSFKNVDLDINNQYKFSVMATSDDGGLITYDWRRAGIGANPSSYDSLSAMDEYVETEDTVWSDQHPYYTKTTTNGIDSYHVKSVPSTDINEEIPEGEGPYYEKRSTYTAHEVGNYWVVAKNRRGNSISETISTYVRIPGPGELSVLIDNNLQEDEEHKLQVILDANGEFELEVTGATSRVGQPGASGDKITYTWSEIPEEGDAIIRKNETKDNNIASTYTEEVDAANIAKFDKTFKVVTVASRNGSSTDPNAHINYFRVTDSAHAPEVVQPQEVDLDPTTHTASITAVPTLNGNVSDRLEYKWYLADQDELNSENPGANDTLIEASEYAQNVDTATITVSDFFRGQRIYCIVTNYVNGTHADSKTPIVRSNSPDRRMFTAINA